MFAEAAFKFFKKIGCPNYDAFKFFLNGRELVPKSASTLDEYGIKNNNIIDVIEIPSILK